MFANVRFTAWCPFCGLKHSDWQTQDPDELDLQTVEPTEVNNYYTNCHEPMPVDEVPVGYSGPISNAYKAQDKRYVNVGCGAWLEITDGVLTVTPKKHNEHV